jgi:hypothetical protein
VLNSGYFVVITNFSGANIVIILLLVVRKMKKRCGRDEILSLFISYEADGGLGVVRVLILQLCQGLVENDWLQALVLVDFIKVGQESWLYRQCGYAI